MSLVSKCSDHTKRLGCEEKGGFNPLKSHMFFETISWENLHVQTPPKLTPYLPAMAEDDEDYYGNVSLPFILDYLFMLVCHVTWHKMFSHKLSF